MPGDQKQELPVASIIILLSIFLALGGLWFLITSAVATGAATLPNGSSLSIKSDFRGFGVAQYARIVEVDIAGLAVEFSGTKISVDGVEVSGIDESVKQHALSSMGGVVTLISGDRTIVLSD